MDSAIAPIKFAESHEGNSAGSSSRKALSSDLYSTWETAMPAGEEWAIMKSGGPSLPAGKGQKPSWGFGGEAPDLSALGAAGSPSLDTLENNRHRNGAGVPDYYRRPRGRGKFCGRYSVKGLDPKTGRTNFRRINCGSWSCSYCGPRKARTARAAIRRKAEALDLKYFLTLTLDPKKA